MYDLFSDFFDGFDIFMQPVTVKEEKKCPVCGHTYSDFRRTGKIGCSECYKVFRTPIAETLRQVQPSTVHTGKIPSKSGEELKLKRKYETLKQELSAAVWYKDNNSDIAVSTRIRLARNLDKTPFPNALKDTKEVTEKIKNAILGSNSTLAKDFDFIDLDNTPTIRKQEMAEEHLISPVMCEGKGKSVLVSKDKTMSIMLMEEDHIRLQIIKDGYALEDAYSLASKVDDVIEENVTYAFDNDFGYLTACPTNTGTGMRASVMLHLPALTMTENINKVIASAGSLGIEVRGLYGEGTKAYGSLYQISNRVTLGMTEEQSLERLKNIVGQVIEMETKARKALTDNSMDALSDKLYRSYGTLKYARSISSSEAKSLLSDVMLGQNLGILPMEGKITPLECMVITEPALLCGGKELSPAERDKKRAELIRNNI